MSRSSHEYIPLLTMPVDTNDEQLGRTSLSQGNKSNVDANVEIKYISEEFIQHDLQKSVDRAYERKCALINKCLQEEIGFGPYQKQLFMLTGLGWLADNMWFQAVAVALPQVQKELHPSRIEFTTLSLYAGLAIGASAWGVMADIIGRKLSFNITLFLAGVFGVAAGAAPNFVAFASLVGCIGFGVGGNLPVDGALYLEHIPQSHQWTLTLLSTWWAIGQLIASLVAWALIGNFSCDISASDGKCLKADNMGWRYTMYTLGCLTLIMFILRFFLFDLQESSKYLIGKKRDAEAIKVLEHLAKKNNRTITLTLEKLLAVEDGDNVPPKTILEILKGSFSTFSLSHIRPLFAGRKLAINSSITIFIWGLIGLASPLFNAFLPLYLAGRVSSNDSTSVTYRNATIVSIMGIPGSFIACLVVDWRRRSTGSRKWSIGGRKLTMAVSTLVTGIFLFLFTTSKSEGAVLGYSCVSSLTQNAMFGVLYAYTPEVFPAPHRGTGDALASSFNRCTGLLGPVIKIATTSAVGTGLADSVANGSVFVSASLYVVASIFMMLLPIETAGKAAL
ncbi:MFS general substrate transporter [Crucibulum laeve]|uniref:MFS general substrate transporter n=1 Tax=Crucibulum laeve TaxID=68775 RepID=A0A5C3LQG4_9AGAR|nr:MFS general substrate transporter [Crucibulum laeve]